jgi:hypothetical protein
MATRVEEIHGQLIELGGGELSDLLYELEGEARKEGEVKKAAQIKEKLSNIGKLQARKDLLVQKMISGLQEWLNEHKKDEQHLSERNETII